MPQRISGVTAIPNHIEKPAEPDATQVGQGVEHITAAMREEEVLDQLADRGMQREYAECPPGPDPIIRRATAGAKKIEAWTTLSSPVIPGPASPWGEYTAISCTARATPKAKRHKSFWARSFCLPGLWVCSFGLPG